MPPDQAKREIEAVSNYYQGRSIGGGWMVYAFRAKGQRITAKLEMASDEQACAFLHDGADQRHLMLSVACPFDSDAIWEKIDPSHDIELQVSCSGEVYEQMSCRRWHRNGSSNSEGGTAFNSPEAKSIIAELERKTNAGDADAEAELARRLSDGDGVPQDEARANKLFEHAAIHGSVDAQVDRAVMNDDLIIEYAWDDIASRSPTPKGEQALRDRNWAERRMTDKQIAEAKKLAAAWKIGQPLVQSTNKP